MNENRVKQYYEAACEYLSLTVSVRFIIATHFDLAGPRTMAYYSRDQMDHDVFVGIAKRKMLPEFNKMVQYYKESADNEPPV